MCTHDRPPTYWHVIDENNGEHIATYTSYADAYTRRNNECLNGRFATTVMRLS